VKKLLVGLIGVVLLGAFGPAAAQTIAYDSIVQPGNQQFNTNLGMDFDVNQPIVVSALGAFNANAPAGFVGTISVGIFNRDTTAQVGPTATLTGTNGTLVNGDRFITLSAATQIVLVPGHYSIVAIGFSATDQNGNQLNGAPFTFSTENTGGGLITFVGTGRFDFNTTLDYPATLIVGTQSNSLLAGTFRFVAAVAPTLTKAFGGSIPLNGTTSLTFTVTNSNAGGSVTGLAFTDTLPAGLKVATPNGLTGSCGGGTIMATAGSSAVSLSGASLGPSASCTFSVTVLGTQQGVQTNTTSTLASTNSGTGAAATATVLVGANTIPVMSMPVLAAFALLLAGLGWVFTRKQNAVS